MKIFRFQDGEEVLAGYRHIEMALDWLLSNRDHRGLSYISQGDWCDPMNMVGYKGKGVSSWLTLATAYSIKCWLEIAENYLPAELVESNLAKYKAGLADLNKAVNEHCWDGKWYARGITDDGVCFGIEKRY